MIYATVTDMTTAFGFEEILELSTLDDAAAQSIDAAVIEGAIADASGLINGYLQGRYTLPLLVIPAMLRRICCDIARYYLHRIAPSEDVLERYKNALKLLSEIGTGRVDLGLTVADSPAAVGGLPIFVAGDRVFTAANLQGY